MALKVDKEMLLLLGEKLRETREAQVSKAGKKVYQRDAANVLAVHEDTYRAYEYGRAILPEKHAKVLALEWGMDWKEFYVPSPPSKTKPRLPYHDVSAPSHPEPVSEVDIPFVGSVGANSKVDWLDPIEDTNDMIPVPAEMATAKGPKSLRFCSHIVGDSCYPLLLPDDLVVWHKYNIAKIGHVMLFRSTDMRVTVKQVQYIEGEFILHPLNPKYQDEKAEGTVLGYLVGIIRKQDGMKITMYNPDGIIPRAA